MCFPPKAVFFGIFRFKRLYDPFKDLVYASSDYGRMQKLTAKRKRLGDRVRGFCTRWEGRDLLNMQYYARVKRAGASTAPPAQAQLMYEPQIYGLSPNTRVQSKP